MHELSITQSLLDIALRHADEAGATRINELKIVVGELSSIIDDSVQFYWDMISHDTIAEGALLTFKRIPAALRCDDCGHEFPLNREQFTCPACGSGKIRVTSGDEFYLESIDVNLEPESER
ncbi:MAG: hydrogenase maturation nickel metallochaperone HypA [Anaerolineae bacterium]|nr:hydrogenase maturation nickel metallochaperone HypA [Anaerolineae bacterium]